MPYLQVLSDFREGVRKIAREKKGEAGSPESCRGLRSLHTATPFAPAASSHPWELGVGVLGQGAGYSKEREGPFWVQSKGGPGALGPARHPGVPAS